ncbi:chorismate synthase [Desulfurella multipotens]|uniref:Chorismate synthase n=1 Tax=Desulfurella multipotens TaxID=79269 RepID=A0A1G6I3K8_9BACT|nr:chorismate synthase [Desulfurella multipotens]SDC00316.1 chorismate synthase [Desulfurella multipotens]
MISYLDAGESHGNCLCAIIDGLPAGLNIDVNFINNLLSLRQSGYGRGGRQKIEKDKIEILSGVRFGQTIGSPITLKIANNDYKNWQDIMAPFATYTNQKQVTKPRPGHVDLVGYLKYDRNDMRDCLERSSARQTAIRVAVGAICELCLKEVGVNFYNFVSAIGNVKANIDYSNVDEIKNNLDNELLCPDKNALVEMKKIIDYASQNGDSLGGVAEVIVEGVVAGIGSYKWDKKLDARIALAVMSVQAIKAVSIGEGVENAFKYSSQVQDEIFYDSQTQTYKRFTNRLGGIEGGISNGENIIVKAYMKPIPTTRKGLRSVDVKTKEAQLSTYERSDVCATSAASVVIRAAIAFEILNAYLEKFGGDCINEFKTNVNNYKEYLKTK